MGGEKGTLTVYFWAFAGIVLGGGFYALANLMYYALVIMRRQKTVFFVYAAAAVAAFFLSGVLVGAFGINGAALCYLLLMAMLLLPWIQQSLRIRNDSSRYRLFLPVNMA